MLELSPFWPTPRPSLCTCQQVLQPRSARYTHNPGSHIHQWMLQPSKVVPRVPLPGLLPGFACAGRCFNPAWPGPHAVTALTGGCCNLPELDAAHTLYWLLCVTVGAADLLGWSSLSSSYCALQLELQPSRRVLQVPPPGLLPAPDFMHVSRAITLHGLVCPQSWPLHMLVGAVG